MYKHVSAALLGLTLVLYGCGSSSSNNGGNINGNWTAVLNNTNNTPEFNLTTTFTQMNGSEVSVTNLKFNTATPCFVSGETGSASFVLSGNFNGSVTGAFQFTVKSENPSGDTLTMQGTANGNTITGMWTLVGISSGCTGNGKFVVTKM